MTATQLINLDILDPTTISVFGGSLGQLSPFPGGFALPVAATFAGTLSAQMIILNPGAAEGFTLSQAAQANMQTCTTVLLKDFGSAVVGNPGVYPAGWVDGGGQFPWRVHTGSTPFPGTGPTGDYTSGTGNYIYCEADGLPILVVSNFIIETQPIPTTTLGTVPGVLSQDSRRDPGVAGNR